MRSFFLLLICVLLVPTKSLAQTFDEKFEHWPVDITIGGRIIMVGQGKLSENQSRAFSRLFDSKKATYLAESIEEVLKFLPDAEIKKDQVLNLLKTDKTGLQERLKSTKYLAVLSTNQWKGTKSKQGFVSILKQWIASGNALLISSEVAKEYCLTDPKQFQIPSSHLIPGCIVLPNLDSAKQEQLMEKLKGKMPMVGLGLSEDCLCVLEGRKFYTVRGQATFSLPKHNKYLEEKVQVVLPRLETRRFPGSKSLLDLTQWRRMAIDRTLDQFPAEKPNKPFVKNGTLVIVGGGGMPRGLMGEIIEFAGGKDKAKMVFVPCSEQVEVSSRQGMVNYWKRMGVKEASFIHTKDRLTAHQEKEFSKSLQDATGIWFGGGRQWNFSDSYYGTETHRLMKKVLDRGGVIGGSSAGASIQARYLARATPIGNFDIMAPGYERGGLGFLSGVAIDQHFSQRRRQPNMTSLIKRYPQLLGIGIDEATAIIVQKSKASIVGRGRVFFYDAGSEVNEKGKEFVALPAGSVYDLAKRVIVKDTRNRSGKEQKK